MGWDKYDISPLPNSLCGPKHPTRCRDLIDRLAEERFVCPGESYKIIEWYALKYNYSYYDILKHAFENKSCNWDYLTTGTFGNCLSRSWQKLTEQEKKEYYKCCEKGVCYRCKCKVIEKEDCAHAGGQCYFCGKIRCHYLVDQHVHRHCDEIKGWAFSKAGCFRLRKVRKIQDREIFVNYVTYQFLGYIAEQRRIKCQKNQLRKKCNEHQSA
jgi:hypothetical protein